MKFVLVLVLNVFFVALIGRLILDWIQVLAKDWHPRGPVLFVSEGIYTVTDPPLKFLRRVIPPLSLGGLRLDLGFLVLILAVQLALQLLR